MSPIAYSESVALPPTAANPYPSTIAVSVPFNGTFQVVNVRLNGLTHTFPDDLDALLAGPAGGNAIIMSDVGGSGDVAGVTLTLTDGATANIPDAGPLVSGTFRPTNITPGTGTETWPAPAPAPLGGSALSVFTGTDPNGTWELYFVDDQGTDSGSWSGGWCMDLLAGCASDDDCEDHNPCTIDACVDADCQTTTKTCDDGNP